MSQIEDPPLLPDTPPTPMRRSHCLFTGHLSDEARTLIARALVGIGADLTSLEPRGGDSYSLSFDLPAEADREAHLRALVEVQEAVEDLGHACALWEAPFT